MCRVYNEAGGVVFGSDRLEEAYAHAPFVLKPVNKRQLLFLTGMLRVWLTSEDDYEDDEEREQKRKQFMPLFYLEAAVVKSQDCTFIPWGRVHDKAFDAIDNAGGWKDCYEKL